MCDPWKPPRRRLSFNLFLFCTFFTLLGYTLFFRRLSVFTMAWRSTGVDNQNLVDNLRRNGIIKDDRVYRAMLAIDRGNFAKSKGSAFIDSPQPIGYGVTISAPHMHAHALEILSGHLKPGSRALDVGSGSGYLTACMGMMVGDRGKVVGIDHIDGLVKDSLDNMKKQPETESLLMNGIVRFVVGDGRQGYAENGPYDAIHVGAAAPELPQPLVDQLSLGGRLITPVGKTNQWLVQVDKSMTGEITQTKLMAVRYVPLTAKEKQFGRLGYTPSGEL